MLIRSAEETAKGKVVSTGRYPMASLELGESIDVGSSPKGAGTAVWKANKSLSPKVFKLERVQYDYGTGVGDTVYRILRVK